MSLPDHIERWIDRYLRLSYPELEVSYRHAFQLYNEAESAGALRQEALSVLVEFATDRRTVLSQNVASMLGQLADRFIDAQGALRALARSSKAHARINALAALDSHKRSQVHEEILRRALCDRSVRVRSLAADKIQSFGLRQLLPDLEAAIADAKNAKIRDVLEWERDLLRDGYRLRAGQDGRVDATVRHRSGGCVTSTVYSAAEFKSKGIRQVVEELGGEWNG